MRIYAIWIDGRRVDVKLYFESRLLRALQKLRIVGPWVAGFTPWNIHFRDAAESVSLELVAHECCHILDRETAPFPRRIMHPLRSLVAMIRHGYRESPYEQRAYNSARAIANGEYPRVVLSLNLIQDFKK